MIQHRLEQADRARRIIVKQRVTPIPGGFPVAHANQLSDSLRGERLGTFGQRGELLQLGPQRAEIVAARDREMLNGLGFQANLESFGPIGHPPEHALGGQRLKIHRIASRDQLTIRLPLAKFFLAGSVLHQDDYGL